METLKIGLGWWGFRKLPLERHWEIARSLGFRTMEMGLGNRFDNVSPDLGLEAVREIAQKAKAQGIRLTYATQRNDFLVSPDRLPEEIKNTLKCLEVAAGLGVRFVRIYGGLKSSKETTKEDLLRMGQALEECQQRADALGVTLCLETMGAGQETDGFTRFEDSVITDRQKIEATLQVLPEGMKILFDPANVKAIHGEDPAWMLPFIRDRLAYFHIKEWCRAEKGWRPGAVGDGGLNFSALLRQAAFPGPYLIEYENPKDLESGIQKSLQALEKMGFSLEKI